MAEDKKAFLQGKMNKDIDARLLPNGEYRHAQNIQIATSEGQDVGTIQNIKGNSIIKLVPDLTATYSNLETIGSYFDEANDRIFYFITNYTCENSELAGTIGSIDGPTPVSVADTTGSDFYCAILLYTQTSGIKILCQGHFLNFTKTHEITGINILNNLLFFTDNFNQPRRINIDRALNDFSFYDSEQKISVAKFAPVFPLRLLASDNSSTMETDDNIEADFLENQFIRFSYRFKYIDGEYSVIAPFTQAVFIPEIYEKTKKGFSAAEVKSIVQTGEVEGMVNCINKVIFKLQMPTSSANAFDDYQIKEVQLLCKVDGDLPVRVVDIIPSTTNLINSSGVINYTYKSAEPFKTLPEDQVTRVFDNVPLKAQSQEAIGNRIVYGNYFEKRSLSNTQLDFEINTATKNSADSNNADYLYNEYKYHSLKQRRKYQVGIVLSDIYGRQTPVLLPKETASKTSIERSSVYLPAKTAEFFNSKLWSNYSEGVASYDDVRGWGDVLRIRFDDIIGNAYSATNLYGWYSYKIVVQQQEQEYYNVYTSGVYKSGPYGFINLEADNINKIPRDVTDINANDALVGSDSKIYPKIINHNTNSPTATGYAPGNGSLLSSGGLISVLSIGTIEDHNLEQTASAVNVTPGSNGILIAKIPTTDSDFPSQSKQGGIAVFETEPFNSKIDIFYETSSAGLVNDLNTVISSSQTGLSNIEINKTNGVKEDSAIGDIIGKIIASNDVGPQAATITLLSTSVKKPSDADFETAIDYFELDSSTSPGENLIRTKKLFWFGQEGLQFKFEIKAEFGGATLTREITVYSLAPGDQVNEIISLQNALPIISVVGGSTSISISQTIGHNVQVAQVEAVNGTADTNHNTEYLTFRLTREEQNNNPTTNFTINQDTGEISTTNYSDLQPQTTYNLVIAVFETWADNVNTTDPASITNPYATIGLDITTDTGTNLVNFFMSSADWGSDTEALTGTASTGAFLEGDGPLPTAATGTDKIYTKLDGILIPLDTGGRWRTMSSTSGQSEGAFKTNSQGIVTGEASN